MPTPILKKAIPNQVVNERAAYGPFDLKEFIEIPAGSSEVHFQAEQQNGHALPAGMICTREGILTGIPAKNTAGTYTLNLHVKNESGGITVPLILIIKPPLEINEGDYFAKLKAQVWSALDQRLPLPDLIDVYDRPITPIEFYYLLERWGIIKIWDAFNLDPPSGKQLLMLEGMSERYDVYDRGSCLVACPKDLFDHNRTLEDGIQTAKAMAREVYKRGWTIELVGFEKLTRAAWVELQHLGDQYGKHLEIINFEPTPDDIKLYTTEALNLGFLRPE